MLLNHKGRRFKPQKPKAAREPQPLQIRIALIDPWKQEVRHEVISMDPAAVQAVLDKATVSWAKIGVAHAVDVMFAADQLPQPPFLGNPEPEYQLSDEFGQMGPVVHGKGMVFGFAVAAKKAVSIPVDLDWVLGKVAWLSPLPESADA